MKTRLIYLFLLFACLSCGSNKPVSESQKEKIRGELKEIVNAMTKGVEEANLEVATQPWLNSPDFFCVSNGKVYTFKDFPELKKFFDALLNQKVTVLDEKYVFIDRHTVLYTSNTRCLMNFKDGHTVNQEPWVTQYLFRKVDGKWRVINYTEGGIEQYIKSSEVPKGLNQLELMKQFVGTWKVETPDTVAYYQQNDNGMGLEVNFKYLLKGEIINQGKQLWGYDKNTDRITFTSTGTSGRTYTYALWFVSKTKYMYVPLKNIDSPQNSSFISIGEFPSPDINTETHYQNNKPILSETYKRVGK